MATKGKAGKKSSAAKPALKDLQVRKGKAGKVKGGKPTYGPEAL